MNVLAFTEKGFVLSQEYIEFCFQKFEQSELLKKGYSVNNFFDIVSKNYIVVENLLSFIDYINNGMEQYIVDDLNDIINVFNEHEGTMEAQHLYYEYNEEDISYIRGILEDKFAELDIFTFDSHIHKVLADNYKLLNETKKRSLAESQFYKNMLIQSIQVALVGRPAPAPCAKGYIKREYYALYSNLKKRH